MPFEAISTTYVINPLISSTNTTASRIVEITHFVTGLVHVSLVGPSSNLGRRYISVAVCLSTSGNKLELVRQMLENYELGVCNLKC
jgi:hypothetical protein